MTTAAAVSGTLSNKTATLQASAFNGQTNRIPQAAPYDRSIEARLLLSSRDVQLFSSIKENTWTLASDSRRRHLEDGRKRSKRAACTTYAQEYSANGSAADNDSLASSQNGRPSFKPASSTSLWNERGPSDMNPSKEEIAVKTAERQKIFNNIAPMYDQLNDWLSLGQHRIWKRMTVNWSRAKKGQSALDICCGSGDIAFLAAERVGPTGRVTGLDFAPEQLAVAAKRQVESFQASRVDMRWVEGDALALPFDEGVFDAITMGYGLRNVADIPQSLREIRRVLKRGSKAAILDFNNPTDPVVSAFQGFMLDNVVVPVATQFGMAAEYQYLRPSIERFPTGREQIRLAREAGFSKAVHYELAGGLMGVLVLDK